MKVLLHLGAHKTASTFVQRFLKANRAALQKKYDTYYLTPTDFHKLAAYKVVTKIRAGGSPSVAEIEQGRSSVKKWIESCGSSNAIFSHEGIFGNHQLDLMGELYPFYSKNIHALAIMFSDFDCRVSFFVRRQDSFIESTYMQRLNYGNYLPFIDYINAIDMSSLCWLPLAKDLLREFSSPYSSIFVFERIRKGQNHFISLLLQPLFSVDADSVANSLAYAGIDNVNVSLSQVAVEIASVSFPLLCKEDRLSLVEALRERFSNSTHDRPVLFSNKTKNFLIDHFRGDNKKLLEFIDETDQELVSYYLGE